MLLDSMKVKCSENNTVISSQAYGNGVRVCVYNKYMYNANPNPS